MLISQRSDERRNLHWNPKMSIDGITPTAKRVQIKSHNLLLGSDFEKKTNKCFLICTQRDYVSVYVRSLWKFWWSWWWRVKARSTHLLIFLLLISLFFFWARKWGENNFSSSSDWIHLLLLRRSRSITSLALLLTNDFFLLSLNKKKHIR